MFLRLPTVIAGGRALGALACVLASMSGHAAMGHHHLDVPRAAFAFLLLLAASWRTHDVRWLLLAAQASQVVVHGGLTVATPRMLLMHWLFGLLSALLVWRLELVWVACGALVEPLRRAVAVATSKLPSPGDAVRSIPAFHVPSLLQLPLRCIAGRAPPIPA